MKYLSIFLYYIPRTSKRPATPEEKMTALIGVIFFFSLLLIVFGGLMIRKMLLNRKSEKVKKFIREFSVNDPFWNEKEMTAIAREIFHAVQQAWMKGHFIPLAGYVSDKIKIEWNDTWKKMQEMDYAFLCGSLDIKRVALIAAEDHDDNEQDRFIVSISGYAKRYMKNRVTKNVVTGHTSRLEYFTDIYSFIRMDDQWLLDGIQYNAGFLEVLNKKSIH